MKKNLKCLLDQGKPYADISRGYGVSKTITYPKLKLNMNPNRPCNEPGHPKVLKKPGCRST
jgi:hypothetical protein